MQSFTQEIYNLKGNDSITYKKLCPDRERKISDFLHSFKQELSSGANENLLKGIDFIEEFFLSLVKHICGLNDEDLTREYFEMKFLSSL